MLTAISSTQKQVIAWETSRNEGPFSCPECGFSVVLKAGQKKIHHFAHAPGAECEFGSGETEEHMRIKRELYETLLAAPGCINWAMERHIYDGVVRPDLSGRINNVPLVIEIQRSNTTVEIIAKRFQEYSQRGIAMLWVLTKSPTEGSSTLADWKQYLNLIYQGVLYVHDNKAQVNIVKCDYNSWTVRTYHTKTIGMANIAKDFVRFKVDPINDGKFSFEGGWIWNSKQIGEILLDDAIKIIRGEQLLIEDMEKEGDVDKCYDKIDKLKKFITTIRLPEAQDRQLKDFLSTFDNKCEIYKRNVVANAQAIAEWEARNKKEREEWEKLIAKRITENPERDALYAEARAWFAARKKITSENKLSELEIQEKVDRELWRAEKSRRRREMGQNIETSFAQTVYEPAYDKESWKKRLAEQNASAEAWEKKKAEQANINASDNQMGKSSQDNED